METTKLNRYEPRIVPVYEEIYAAEKVSKVVKQNHFLPVSVRLAQNLSKYIHAFYFMEIKLNFSF